MCNFTFNAQLLLVDVWGQTLKLGSTMLPKESPTSEPSHLWFQPEDSEVHIYFPHLSPPRHRLLSPLVSLVPKVFLYSPFSRIKVRSDLGKWFDKLFRNKTCIINIQGTIAEMSSKSIISAWVRGIYLAVDSFWCLRNCGHICNYLLRSPYGSL